MPSISKQTPPGVRSPPPSRPNPHDIRGVTSPDRTLWPLREAHTRATTQAQETPGMARLPNSPAENGEHQGDTRHKESLAEMRLRGRPHDGQYTAKGATTPCKPPKTFVRRSGAPRIRVTPPHPPPPSASHTQTSLLALRANPPPLRSPSRVIPPRERKQAPGTFPSPPSLARVHEVPQCIAKKPPRAAEESIGRGASDTVYPSRAVTCLAANCARGAKRLRELMLVPRPRPRVRTPVAPF